MESQSRLAWSDTTAGTGTAIITIGRGEWIIESAAAIMGAAGAALNGRELGVGYLVFEELDGGGAVIHSQYLEEGFCTMTFPLITKRQVRVRGPGRVKSNLQHGGPSTYQHSLRITYRRIRDEH